MMAECNLRSVAASAKSDVALAATRTCGALIRRLGPWLPHRASLTLARAGYPLAIPRSKRGIHFFCGTPEGVLGSFLLLSSRVE